jgi:hypothetical protein
MNAKVPPGAVDPKMPGRNQVIILVLTTLVAAFVLVAWTTGLLDTDDGDEGEVLLEHEWRAEGTEAEAEYHDANLSFQVASGTDRLRLVYSVELPSDLTVGLPGSLESPSPEVRLEMLDVDGTVVWSDSFDTSASSSQEVNVTGAGGWTLRVWARAYGYEGETGFGTSVEFHDSVELSVRGI